MQIWESKQFSKRVALLAEGVDRNLIWGEGFQHIRIVALLAEGVDRNSVLEDVYNSRFVVALLAEGVDRNFEDPAIRAAYLGRPPRGGRG